ncbi:hypothetical protein [Fluviicola sp.]|uniref:hypothetical protein n=1 Tax=Fluviicola sp. TaxID=1917219 RepID=UPI0028395363|nr:hypothetical protein [Fluviicola sp.]MDR0801699.1 hypothetical protein [Fluviicola sp.]
MHGLIEEIAALFGKIKSGKATLNELEAFTAATNQLNERAIVLRYKAYETKVYGNPASGQAISEISLEKEEPAVELKVEEVHPELQQDLSRNDKEESSFDLFGMAEEESELTFDLAEEVTEEEPNSDEEEEIKISDPLIVQEVKPEPVTEKTVENPGNLHPVYGKLNSNDGTLAARLMTVHLDTLKGAFGFNERLQIIQELFNGSNDEFNQLIDQLEGIQSKDAARSLVSSYAMKYQWDVDSQLAIELIQKVERKYV